MANFAPSVDIIKKQVEISTSLLLTDMISVFDIEGDPITRWRFIDNGFLNYSGFFSVNGVKQAAGTWVEVGVSQINTVRFNAGLIPTSENIGVQVYDGTQWSIVDFDAIATVPFNAFAPIVNAVSSFVLESEARTVSDNDFTTLAAGDMFTVFDQDGDAPVRFYIVDRSAFGLSGRFVLNGVPQAQGRFFVVEANQMAGLRYIGGGFGTATEQIGIMAFDGKQWGPVTNFNLTTTPNQKAPDLTPNNVSSGLGGSTAASNLFTISDEDGNTIKSAWFLDTGLGATSGYFSVNGVKQAAGNFFKVAYEDIASVRYHFSNLPEIEQLRMQFWDGRYLTPIKTTTATAIPLPTIDVPTTSLILDNLEKVLFSSLFSQTDFGPPFIRYEVVDRDPDLTTARIIDHNGSRLLGNRIYTYTAAEFESIQIEGGLTDLKRGQERMMVRAFNGAYWTEWTNFDVATEPVGPRALDSRFAINVTDDPTRTITYTFMDGGNVNSSPAPFYYPDETPFAVPLTAGQRAMVREVFAMYQSFLDVVYVEVPYEQTAAEADIVLLHDDIDGPSNILAFAGFPIGETKGRFAADVVFDVEDYPDDSTVGLGEEMRATTIHELGHSHGLKHSFDGTPRLPVAIDDDRHTVMSYNRTGLPFSNPRLSTSEPASIMLYDIMQLQNVYGVNTTYRTGDDHYRFDASNTYLHAFWDAGGNDTLNYTNMTQRVDADLRQGQFQFLNGLMHLVIPHGVEIENLRGGTNNDSLIGNELRNFIYGNNGSDILVGNGGNDYLRGGAGDDTYRWQPGDGFDVIDEEGLAGRDVLEVHDFAGSLDTLQDDMAFRRLGNDLRIDFSFNRAQTLGAINIKNQEFGGFRLETLRLFDVAGNRIGNDIDLTSIMAQATSVSTRFQLTNFQSAFGYIAQPV